MRLALVGAGSAVFSRTLVQDLLLSALEGVELLLVDPDEGRLGPVLRWAQALLARFPQKGFSVRPASLREALEKAEAAVLVADVGGEEAIWKDYEIPLRYGVDQSIGDTLGPGGLMKLLRLHGLLEEVAAGFGGSLLLNYMNPLSATTAYLLSRGHRAVGLCHSVSETAKTLAGYLGVPPEGLAYRALGVNHLSFFVELRFGEEDLYPRLKALAQDPAFWDRDPVRFEVLRVFGLFPSESSGHVSEYLPYFRKRPEVLARYARPGYGGESGFYARNHGRWVEEARRQVGLPEALRRSGEYAATVLEAFYGGEEAWVYATLPNRGHVPELLPFVVEVPVWVRRESLEAEGGSLPPGPAALARRAQEVHQLWVQGLLEESPEALLQGLALDPLTGAVLDLRGVEALFRELASAHGDLMPVFLRRWLRDAS
ncbi:glycosyl hydrolase family 4 [Thermus sp.]|uniref:family 4 glycosyl hydrolase n=1 Tax=Thermus sp. TaxID=275 RepID=UPI0032209DB6